MAKPIQYCKVKKIINKLKKKKNQSYLQHDGALGEMEKEKEVHLQIF